MIDCSLRGEEPSPSVAGIVVGLRQIPAFPLIETALGESSSDVTIGELRGSAVVGSTVAVAALYGLERWRPWRTEMGRDVDGDFEDSGDVRISVVGGPATPAE